MKNTKLLLLAACCAAIMPACAQAPRLHTVKIDSIEERQAYVTYDPARGSWTAWLTALTRNTALNRARKKSGGSEELSGDLPSAEPTPEERLLQQERRQALERALTALPQRDRLLFYRKYYYRQSTAQIAAELGTTERAVEGRLYRIKKALRKALGGDEA